MTEPKPLASLSSGLLVRKGDARPAMRRAYVPSTAVSRLPTSLQQEAAHEDVHDDLGWNDMGHEVHVPAPVPFATMPIAMPEPAQPEVSQPPVVHQQQERLSQSFTQPVAKPVVKAEVKAKAPRAAKPRAAAKAGNAKAAFTLRLEAERHLRLRLASAVRNQSAQQLVTEALDRFLESFPGLSELAANAQTSTSQPG